MSITTDGEHAETEPVGTEAERIAADQDKRTLDPRLKIQDSEIDVGGVGVFAVEDVPAETELGTTNVMWVVDGVAFPSIRTPLGGFLNNAEVPNCQKLRRVASLVTPEEAESIMTPGTRAIAEAAQMIGFRLVTLRDIEAGTELTVTYAHLAGEMERLKA